MEPILYRKLKRATPGFHWQRHEDKYASGIPDCSYGFKGKGGWVELKTYDSWPRDPDSPLKFTDLKPEQVNWILSRGRTQGRCFFLVGVGPDWFIINYKWARHLGKMTKDQLLDSCDMWGSKSLSGIHKILLGKEYR